VSQSIKSTSTIPYTYISHQYRLSIKQANMIYKHKKKIILLHQSNGIYVYILLHFKIIQWNLDFMFLDSTHDFIGPVKTSIRTMLNFPEYTFVLSIQFLNYTFKLSINWHVAIILSTSNWKWKERKLIFSYYFLSPLLSSCMLITLWLQGHARRAEPCFLPLPNLFSDEWLVTWLISGHKFHMLIKLLC
jgi:hypothetical protein